MREIKFRAWDKVNKKMIYSPMAICSGDGGWVLFTAEVENMSCYNAIHPIQQYEIMQFTGLVDKSGKNVFEGDIAKHSNGVETSLIEDIHAFCGECGIYGDNPRDVEIIGNLYETPELLKETQ